MRARLFVLFILLFNFCFGQEMPPIVQESLRDWMQTDDIEDMQVEPLAGGLEATMYVVTCGDIPYVLRILPERRDAEHSLHEMQITKRTGELHLGPEVYYMNHHTGVIIMEYINGNEIQLESDHDLHLLAKSIVKLHCMPIDPDSLSAGKSVFQDIEDQYARIEASGLILPEQAHDAMVHLHYIKTLSESRSDRYTFCHNDLHHSNILRTGNQLFFIDWTYASWADPIYDLATIQNVFGLSEDKMELFCHVYFNNDFKSVDRLYLQKMKPIPWIVWAIAGFHYLLDEQVPVLELNRMIQQQWEGETPRTTHYLNQLATGGLVLNNTTEKVQFAVAFLKAYEELITFSICHSCDHDAEHDLQHIESCSAL